MRWSGRSSRSSSLRASRRKACAHFWRSGSPASECRLQKKRNSVGVNDMATKEADFAKPAAVIPQSRDTGGEQLSLFSREALAAVRKEEGKWRREVLDPAVAKKGPWKKDFTTTSGMEVNPLATPEELADLDFGRDLAFPGEFPYTRGIHPTGYRGRLWTMRQFAGFGTAKQTNERFHYLIAQGQMGLSTAFHLPTLYGYDSDHPAASGEVGKCGVAVDTLADMETIFEGINLEDITVSMTIN